MKALFLLVLLATTAQAQSIQVYPHSRTLICVGDSIYVHYAASGTFNPENKFIIQTSDGQGSFVAFKNVASGESRTDAVFVKMNQTGAKYRVRVISTSPYTVSEDTGEELEVQGYPTPEIFVTGKPLVGSPILYTIRSGANAYSTYKWFFGPNATPSTYDGNIPPAVYYSAPGVFRAEVTETNKAGCSTGALAQEITVHTCNPRLPLNPKIVTGTESGTDSVVLVKAGGSYRATSLYYNNGLQKIFVETGGTGIADFRNGGWFYVQPGGSVIATATQCRPKIMFADGASVQVEDLYPNDTLRCGTVTFGALSVDKLEFADSELKVSFSPASLTINSARTLLRVSIFDLLGRQLLEHGALNQRSTEIVIGALTAGSYFVRVQAEDGATKTLKFLR